MPIVSGVLCDKCGREILWEHMAKCDVIGFARGEGWTCGKRILCPACADIEGTHKERCNVA